jgi:Domain of unknown function (DUF5666)
MRKFLGVMFVAAALAAAACGGKGTTPTAPSPGSTVSPASPGGPASPTAATITGSVRNASANASVGVAGTTMKTGLDAAGHFALGNVPTGDVQLQVSSGSANAMVPILAVQAAQTVEVVVSLSGTSAKLESEVRHGAGEAEIKGLIEALPPTTAASTFRVAGKTVTTSASTVFMEGSITRTFASLKLNERVEVRGSLSNDTVTATRVEMEDADEHAPNPAPNPGPNPNPNPGQNEAEFRGTISGLTGNASAFQFNVGSTVVKGDATTSIQGESNTTMTFAALKNGAAVEVKGVQQTGFVQASRIKLENEQENEPKEAEFRGAISGLTGTASAFQFNVGSTVVKGDATTSITGDGSGSNSGSGGGGNTPRTFADLKNGTQVEVKGVQQTGFVQASRIQIEDDDNNDDNDNDNGEAKVEGTLGSVSGTCPAISSSVNSTKFTASASTRFDNACSSVRSGDKVEVRGTRNTDGSLAATRLRKR